MSTTIKANVSKMFASVEPYLVCNSRCNLGDNAAGLTHNNAMMIADQYESWLLSDRFEATEGVRDWANDSGGWDAEEIESWTQQECLALFVQNIAAELRTCLDADNVESLLECAEVYDSTDWDKEPEFPRGSYSVEDGALVVDFYTGI